MYNPRTGRRRYLQQPCFCAYRQLITAKRETQSPSSSYPPRRGFRLSKDITNPTAFEIRCSGNLFCCSAVEANLHSHFTSNTSSSANSTQTSTTPDKTTTRSAAVRKPNAQRNINCAIRQQMRAHDLRSFFCPCFPLGTRTKVVINLKNFHSSVSPFPF